MKAEKAAAITESFVRFSFFINIFIFSFGGF